MSVINTQLSLTRFSTHNSSKEPNEHTNQLIRYWKADHVETGYLGTEFLGKGSSEHFLQALKSASRGITAPVFCAVIP